MTTLLEVSLQIAADREACCHCSPETDAATIFLPTVLSNRGEMSNISHICCCLNVHTIIAGPFSMALREIEYTGRVGRTNSFRRDSAMREDKVHTGRAQTEHRQSTYRAHTERRQIIK